MQAERQRLIRALFDEYIEMYAARDDRLTTRFSDNFSGYTGGGDFLVKDKAQWVNITRQDFAQVPERIRIEMLDLSLQDIAPDVVVVTAFFHIHLPLPDHILSRETARLVLVFRQEGEAWMIVHSGISIPDGLARDGEVYPIIG
ncbi:MAG TPA: nuclear transport factor 2 family protein, partial [Azospira sp.]|nr:nuclear transport factor 2 family protein [Azospira sp.]